MNSNKDDLQQIQNKKACQTLYTGTVCHSADMLHTPLIEICPVEDESELIFSINKLAKYDYLLFTSRYAVRYWFETLKKTGMNFEYIKGVQVVSIGNTTSQALQKEGIKNMMQPEIDDSYGVIDFFKNRVPGKILIPRSDLALPIIPNGLRRLGYEVTTVVAYCNRCPKHPQKVDLQEIKKIIFTSPSTIDNFIRIYGQLPEKIELETRGRITEEYLKTKR
jgi:uroporphyrinogen III methyltransferase/synthase